MAAAIAATGLPPLSGFIGKLLILQSVADAPGWHWAWGTILATTLIAVIGFARTGSAIFWNEARIESSDLSPRFSKSDLAAPIITIALLAALSAGAGPATEYGRSAAVQVMDRAAAARAVLGEH
ncbi:MAG: hypothetical protein B7Y74_04165 [Novosphingobium sp. 35-62-5]|nr:MAG: hypothetical protein B7Y74_04165 [Novosphingobium sp. 35-62-5]